MPPVLPIHCHKSHDEASVLQNLLGRLVDAHAGALLVLGVHGLLSPRHGDVLRIYAPPNDFYQNPDSTGLDDAPNALLDLHHARKGVHSLLRLPREVKHGVLVPLPLRCPRGPTLAISRPSVLLVPDRELLLFFFPLLLLSSVLVEELLLQNTHELWHQRHSIALQQGLHLGLRPDRLLASFRSPSSGVAVPFSCIPPFPGTVLLFHFGGLSRARVGAHGLARFPWSGVAVLGLVIVFPGPLPALQGVVQ
mmetsp:Transcript_8507/g.24307  ORF Transcript_8507/g.24307 Transcript_8507/m.24307 type:complete len:250 (+) Transcript_8507:1986-2735(+)